jgi:hypothetical protein
MSYTKSYIMNHWAEFTTDDDSGYYERMVEKRKLEEEQMWYEWAENNRFILQDGQIIEGKINP